LIFDAVAFLLVTVIPGQAQVCGSSFAKNVHKAFDLLLLLTLRLYIKKSMAFDCSMELTHSHLTIFVA
jgi:hypothetical protein